MKVFCKALASTLAVITIGCGPQIQTVRLTDLPVDSGHNVELYSTKRPECPYEEIGLITGNQRSWNSMEDVLAAMRTRARAMGGDAIVGLTSGEEVSGAGGEGVLNINTSLNLKGTVVRFTSRSCRK